MYPFIEVTFKDYRGTITLNSRHIEYVASDDADKKKPGCYLKMFGEPGEIQIEESRYDVERQLGFHDEGFDIYV